MYKNVLKSYYNSGSWQTLIEDIKSNNKTLGIFGMVDNEKPMLYSGLINRTDKDILIVMSDYIKASELQRELSAMDESINFHLFPHRPTRLGNIKALSHEDEHQRINVMNSLNTSKQNIVITTIEAMMSKVVTKSIFDECTISLMLGKEYDINEISQSLSNIGYIRCDRVESKGQFSVRGGLLDIFNVTDENAVRIEFFGDEVDSIRTFDPISQRSIENIESTKIIPAVELPLTEKALKRGRDRLHELARKQTNKNSKGDLVNSPELIEYIDYLCESLNEHGSFENIEIFFDAFYPKHSSIHDYMNNPIVIMDDPIRNDSRSESIISEYTTMYLDALESDKALHFQKDLLLEFNEILHGIKDNKLITLNKIQTLDKIAINKIINFESSETPMYRGKFGMLKNDLKKWRSQGFNVVLMAGSLKRSKRLEETLSDFEIYLPVISNDRDLNEKEAAIINQYYSKGFECVNSKFVVITEYELYGVNRYKSKKITKKKNKIDVFNDLEVNDYAVHEVHGIAVYKGVVSLEANDCTRDYIKLSYLDDNVLYVPVEQMDRVEKYVGKDGVKPRINRLGGKQWAKAKAKVKATVEELAEELVALYAAREKTIGFTFAEDDQLQKEFEDQFPYDETADQLTSIQEIKENMQSPKIMDRLLCGDVGYGKTEVALRAIFKAIMSGKQAAILSPTTILAHQHYLTMKKRFAGFPIECGELSRFLTAKEQDKVVANLAKGKIDVVVGTHRLLSKDIKFNDLGLLVVDEEQRFGVSHKEKVKQMRNKVDVLTLTATPIPRTLHMSLSGIRDISILDTPPEERHPVQTFVIEYKESMIRSAILKELERGGKVYFLYNRVRSIDTMASKIRAMVPESKVGVAHGQMNEHELEKTMLGFMGDEYNVLVCTTIIESGLDISSANTLIVYDSDRFGLSQLYQLRGRVGRSNRLAYAYFTWREGKVLTEIAEKRLSAIAQFTEFGSGLKIAMRDLEIRGAGDLLGARQHGHMATVGYGMYCRMIEDAIKDVKGEPGTTEKSDVTLSLNVSANIPHDYINEQSNRLDAYKKISFIQSREDISEVLDELLDRFGETPESVVNLLNVSFIKYLCQSTGIILIRQKADMTLFRFGNANIINGLALFNMANEFDGKIKIINKESITLKYIDKEIGLSEIIDLLLRIKDECIIELESIK